ncbi:nickel pincer cofactor biosynthesis protein LarB [Atrimonas thermophila]|uniref:nickel pincer cofactor biosynthesis protein LarB n=1 Tax=Atrimonas thermophila TaxID=3064161 RepID=UPI00399D55BB
MDEEKLRQLLEQLKRDEISIDEVLDSLKELPFKDLGFAKVDHHRELRKGYPEVVYGEGKTEEQVVEIVSEMLKKDSNILVTRTSQKTYQAVKEICSQAEYHHLARAIVIRRRKIEVSDTYIAVITAGTSDIPVAEEAALTAEMMGNRVERIFDVGVAGIHRLFSHLNVIRGAKVVIVVAGMEGALASVVGGLVERPVIAVPTSVGYGASFKGLAALLAMLNSCASGVAVVNIDNGFGAGYLASLINRG